MAKKPSLSQAQVKMDSEERVASTASTIVVTKEAPKKTKKKQKATKKVEEA